MNPHADSGSWCSTRSLLIQTRLGFQYLRFTPTCKFPHFSDQRLILISDSSSGFTKAKNWFSNQRQEVAKRSRDQNPGQAYDPLSFVKLVTCSEGRDIKVRPSALEHCKAEEWTDELFEQIVLISDYRLMVIEKNKQADMDAASIMLDLKGH